MYIKYTKLGADLNKTTPATALSTAEYSNDAYDDIVGVMKVNSITQNITAWNPTEVTPQEALAEYKRITKRTDLTVKNGVVVFPKIFPQV